MPCYYPWHMYLLSSGEYIADPRGGDVVSTVTLPCGQCVGCRLEHSRQWAVRCIHEASLYVHSSFVTLTYNAAHLPFHSALDYRDFQLFLKRLRKHFQPIPIRFFMCGEYGPQGDRPHYHAILFGIDFDDKVYHCTTSAGSKLFESKTLNTLWSDKGGDPIGFASVGAVSFDSAGYVARYSLKKSYGNSVEQYRCTDPETGEIVYRPPPFIRMSLKPGLGLGFYQKWLSDIFPADHVVVNGVPQKPPRYYSKKYKASSPEQYEELSWKRVEAALEKQYDNTEDRLRVKEAVHKAAIKSLKRDYNGGSE